VTIFKIDSSQTELFYIDVYDQSNFFLKGKYFRGNITINLQLFQNTKCYICISTVSSTKANVLEYNINVSMKAIWFNYTTAEPTTTLPATTPVPYYRPVPVLNVPFCETNFTEYAGQNIGVNIQGVFTFFNGPSFFDGTRYVTFNKQIDLVASKELSVCFWMNPTTTTTGSKYFVTLVNENNQMHDEITMTTTTVYLQKRHPETIVTSMTSFSIGTTIFSNRWTYICLFVKDNVGTMHGYGIYNAELTYYASSTKTLVNSLQYNYSKIHIGYAMEADKTFRITNNVYIDDVEIFQVCLQKNDFDRMISMRPGCPVEFLVPNVYTRPPTTTSGVITSSTSGMITTTTQSPTTTPIPKYFQFIRFKMSLSVSQKAQFLNLLAFFFDVIESRITFFTTGRRLLQTGVITVQIEWNSNEEVSTANTYLYDNTASLNSMAQGIGLPQAIIYSETSSGTKTTVVTTTKMPTTTIEVTSVDTNTRNLESDSGGSGGSLVLIIGGAAGGVGLIIIVVIVVVFCAKPKTTLRSQYKLLKKKFDIRENPHFEYVHSY
jgi:hypothetical protein